MYKLLLGLLVLASFQAFARVDCETKVKEAAIAQKFPQWPVEDVGVEAKINLIATQAKIRLYKAELTYFFGEGNSPAKQYLYEIEAKGSEKRCKVMAVKKQ